MAKRKLFNEKGMVIPMIKGTNPVMKGDFPDPDIIRVDDTYYMCSTTMYYMPGGALFRSYDLINWEFVTHVYETLEDTPRENLDGEQNAYSNGMWAPCLRYHNGKYYVVFVANDTHKTYCFTADKPEGPWTKGYIEGFYHDCSLLWDDDGRVYIVHGNREIRLTELKPDLSAPMPGGFNEIIIKDAPGPFLGYEGSHIYKINGKYYIFFIHGCAEEWVRIEAAFMADDIKGPWVGKDVIRYRLPGTTGVAQGGIVDTPDGKWYGFIFADHGAVGRIPNVVPMHFDETGFPVFDTPAEEIETESTRPDYVYDELFKSDNFDYTPDENGRVKLDDVWEFNHNPKNDYWQVLDNQFILTTEKLSRTVEFARNTLTQRTYLPKCAATCTIDASELNDGDYAGLVMLQHRYGCIGIAKEEGKYFIIMRGRTEEPDNDPDKSDDREFARVPLDGGKAELRMEASFDLGLSEVDFYYQSNGEWQKLGVTLHPTFDLRHFVGCRIGLFAYSTVITGGKAKFSEFVYEK